MNFTRSFLLETMGTVRHSIQFHRAGIGGGFTLIELLVVVAVIGILMAIAIPNFQNARFRANAAKVFSEINTLYDLAQLRKIDTGLWLIDGNDSQQGPPERCSFPNGLHFWGKSCESAAIRCQNLANSTAWFNEQIWALLTTPLNYLGTIPLDPFANGMFYGYEDRECANTTRSSHWMIFSTGPDRDHGDWIDQRQAKPYTPSNGLASNGDIWKSYVLNGDRYSKEIGLYNNYF